MVSGGPKIPLTEQGWSQNELSPKAVMSGFYNVKYGYLVGCDPTGKGLSDLFNNSSATNVKNSRSPITA